MLFVVHHQLHRFLQQTGPYPWLVSFDNVPHTFARLIAAGVVLRTSERSLCERTSHDCAHRRDFGIPRGGDLIFGATEKFRGHRGTSRMERSARLEMFTRCLELTCSLLFPNFLADFLACPSKGVLGATFSPIRLTRACPLVFCLILFSFERAGSPCRFAQAT
jgi:hypothetical protein